MKRVALAGMLALSAASFAEAKSLVIVYDDNYAPFSFQNEAGEPDGIYGRIVAEALARIDGYTVTLKATPWKRALAMVEKGKAYGVYPPYYNPDRAYLANYSTPIIAEKFVVVCRADALAGEARDQWPESYFGLRFANQSGFTGPGDAFFAAVERGDIAMREVPNVEAAVQMMAKGRVDCHANAEVPIWSVAAQLHESGAIGDPRESLAQGMVIREEKGYAAFGDDSAFDPEGGFRAKLDAVIEAMRQEGRIDAIFAEFTGE